jgi:hypothetical protein
LSFPQLNFIIFCPLQVKIEDFSIKFKLAKLGG